MGRRRGGDLFGKAWDWVLTAIKSTWRNPDTMMWLTALPPQPPAPMTLIRAPGSTFSINSIMASPPPPLSRGLPRPLCPGSLLFDWLKRNPSHNRLRASGAVPIGRFAQAHSHDHVR